MDDITVTIERVATPAELYCRYDSQHNAQPVYVTLNLASGELTAAYQGSSNSMPASVYDRRELWFEIPPLVDEYANTLLDQVAPLAQRILDGAEIEWDGSNHVGRLDDDARAACDEIERICAECRNSDDSVQVVEYDADDWYAGFEAETFDRLGLTADTTDEELRVMAAAEEAEATTLSSNYGYTILVGAEDWLRRQREEMREDHREMLREAAKLRNALETQLDEVRAGITAGAVRCKAWGESFRNIGAYLGTSHTAVQKMLAKDEQTAPEQGEN